MTALRGQCACGELAYRLELPPLFVHACHCTRCQRETGTAFALNAMIETSQLTLLQGQRLWAKLPTDSGSRHWIARCSACHMAVWNAHGSRSPAIIYLRVGTLDRPQHWPAQAHIFMKSKLPGVVPGDAVPAFERWYDRSTIWPAPSLQRLARAQADHRTRRDLRPAGGAC